MLKLFQKKSKVKEGKQTQVSSKAQQDKKKQAPFAAFGSAWKKLNNMNRKQAYTWGAVILVGVVGLLLLLSASNNDKDNFAEFETRGYDLANMPFSSDEAERYLLAAKYPDMKDQQGGGLYSETDKAIRQEEDAEAAAEEAQAYGPVGDESDYDGYYGGSSGGSYGGGKGGSRTPTTVNRLDSAFMGRTSGSAMSGHFGPSGDFSNFRDQNKGSDKFKAQQTGPADGRKALYQAAVGSRAAAGLKNDKLANAKRAMMGGNIKGSAAFMDDNGSVNAAAASGLKLDTDAPTSSGDISGLDQGLNNANDKGKENAKDDDQKHEKSAYQKLFEDFLQNVSKEVVDLGMGMLKEELMARRKEKRDENKRVYTAAEVAYDKYSSDKLIAGGNYNQAQATSLAEHGKDGFSMKGDAIYHDGKKVSFSNEGVAQVNESDLTVSKKSAAEYKKIWVEENKENYRTAVKSAMIQEEHNTSDDMIESIVASVHRPTSSSATTAAAATATQTSGSTNSTKIAATAVSSNSQTGGGAGAGNAGTVLGDINTTGIQ